MGNFLRSQEGKVNKPALVILLTVIIAAIVFIVIAPVISQIGAGKAGNVSFQSDLAQFYPSTALFFGEAVITPEKIALLTKNKALQEPAMDFLKDVTNSRPMSKDALDQTVSKANETLTIVEKLQKNFDNAFAIGVVLKGQVKTSADKKTASQEETASVAPATDNLSILVAAKLREGANPDDIIAALNNNSLKFADEKYKDQLLHVAVAPPSQSDKSVDNQAYTVKDKTLLLADHVDTLKAALDSAETANNLFNNEEVKTNLKLLPARRIGSVFLDIKNIVANSGDAKGKMLGAKDFDMEKVFSIYKMAVASVDITNDNVLLISGLAPADFSQVENAAVKSLLQKITSKKFSLSAPKVLPNDTLAFFTAYGLRDLFDLQMKFADEKTQTQFNNQKTGIASMTGLNFDTDILGLFDQESAVGFRISDAEKKMPGILLLFSKSDATNQALSKIANLVPKMIDPSVTIKDSKFNSQEIHTLSSPRMPIALSYGSINTNLVGLGLDQDVKMAIVNETQIEKAPEYSQLKPYLTENPVFTMYMNIKKMDEYQKSMNPKLTNKMNNIFDSLLVSSSSSDKYSKVNVALRLVGNN